MNTIYIMRHAEKEAGEFHNAHLRHQDNPISQKGWEHAQDLCAFFADKAIAAIYVSGYVRTWQTAEPFARQFGLTPVVDERLNEIDTGCVELMPDEEVARTYPEMWAAYLSRRSDFRFPEGETGTEARERIVEFIEEKRPELSAGDLLVVCHDGLIRSLMTHVLEMPVYHRRKFKIDFCGICEIRHDPEEGEWRLVKFNHG